MKFKFNAMVGSLLAATSFGSAAVAGGSQKMAEAVLTEVPIQCRWLTEHPWVLATLATLPGVAIFGVFFVAMAQTTGVSKWDMEQVLKGKRPLTTTECFVIANTLGLTVHQLMSDLESDK
ncbi:hypothetical protein QTO17_01415 [Vibrio owensii]